MAGLRPVRRSQTGFAAGERALRSASSVERTQTRAATTIAAIPATVAATRRTSVFRGRTVRSSMGVSCSLGSTRPRIRLVRERNVRLPRIGARLKDGDLVGGRNATVHDGECLRGLDQHRAPRFLQIGQVNAMAEHRPPQRPVIDRLGGLLAHDRAADAASDGRSARGSIVIWHQEISGEALAAGPGPGRRARRRSPGRYRSGPGGASSERSFFSPCSTLTSSTTVGPNSRTASDRCCRRRRPDPAGAPHPRGRQSPERSYPPSARNLNGCRHKDPVERRFGKV